MRLADGFIAAAVELWQRAPRNVFQSICATLEAADSEEPDSAVLGRLQFVRSASLQQALQEVVSRRGSLTWTQVALSLRTIEQSSVRITGGQELEVIWTGPPNEVFPVRRTDQVLYDLLLQAKSRVLLVTFAAGRIPRLGAHLEEAVRKGLKVTLILESEMDSDGQLTIDCLRAFPESVQRGAEIYYWPRSRRELNPAGRPGKLHAKCAVVDEAAILSSANLTDDAFYRNMEMGVVVRGGEVPNTIYRHYFALIEKGVLVRRQLSQPGP